MKDEQEEEALEPEVRPARRISLVWLVPLLAVVLGAWLVYRHLQSQGPLIEVSFSTADGIVAGKTEVRSRAVKVGLVEDVDLAGDMKSVRVKVRMSPKAAGLVRSTSRFWVVRPRVSGAGISGLGTIISGAYIELDPGPDGDEEDDFVGLEEPPVTPSDVPGLRLELIAEDRGEAGVGSPVYHEGNEVGTIERRRFNPDTKKVELRAFISADYRRLVTENTCFWNSSGLEIEAGADGFKLVMPSLEALVGGAVTFGVPEGIPDGESVADGSQFTLYQSEKKAIESVFRSGGEFLLLFDQSVRGLSVGARVEFRGLKVGRVAGISFLYGGADETRRVPVLVQLSETLIEKQFPPNMRDEGGEGLAKAVASGLRGSLRPTSLLTGQLYVDLDYYPDQEAGTITMVGEVPVLPTTETGLALLEEQLAAVLRKLDGLELEESLENINLAVVQTTRTLESARATFERSSDALVEARDALGAIRTVVEDPEFARLPAELRATLLSLRTSLDGVGPNSSAYGDLRRTLDELRGAARSIERVAETIDEKPNALLFGKGSKRDAIPRAVPVR